MLRSFTLAYRTGAEALRLGSVRLIFAAIFQGCIKQLTLELTVDKWDNFAFRPAAAGKFKTNMNEARAA